MGPSMGIADVDAELSINGITSEGTSERMQNDKEDEVLAWIEHVLGRGIGTGEWGRE